MKSMFPNGMKIKFYQTKVDVLVACVLSENDEDVVRVGSIAWDMLMAHVALCIPPIFFHVADALLGIPTASLVDVCLHPLHVILGCPRKKGTCSSICREESKRPGH